MNGKALCVLAHLYQHQPGFIQRDYPGFSVAGFQYTTQAKLLVAPGQGKQVLKVMLAVQWSGQRWCRWCQQLAATEQGEQGEQKQY